MKAIFLLFALMCLTAIAMAGRRRHGPSGWRSGGRRRGRGGDNFIGNKFSNSVKNGDRFSGNVESGGNIKASMKKGNALNSNRNSEQNWSNKEENTNNQNNNANSGDGFKGNQNVKKRGGRKSGWCSGGKSCF